MTFLYWPVLLLLVVPVGLLVWVWARPGRRLVLPFDHGRTGRGWVWLIAINFAESAPALLLAVVLVILAGPQRYGRPQAKRQMTNIELCVDISGSMTAEFGDGSRYDAAMKAVDEFLTYRKGDAIGLTFFGSNVLHWCPLTSDASAIRCAPPFMRPENAPPEYGGTLIGKTLRACKPILVERQAGDRMIVLVSDGDSFDLHGDAAETIARDLRAHDIAVFAILIDVNGRIQDEIVAITATTGGEAFEAGDPEALKGIFQRIDQMKQAPMEKTLADLLDFFWPFCVAGLALLGAAGLASFGLRYTPW